MERAARAVSPWTSCPSELLVDIFKRLEFRDLVACQLACKAWNLLLSAPQESPEAVWGVLELEAHALAEKIVLDDELDQATAVDILKPVCRWVAARAPAITSIKILSLPEHYNSDIFTEWDLDVFLTSLLSMLVGVLTRPVDLDVRMTGREADITLLRDTLFSQKLAPCITSLNLLEQTDFVDADAFYSICSLSRLTYLSLNATFCDRAFEDQAIITSAVSRLTSLRELFVSAIELEPGIGSVVGVPAELAHLPHLTSVYLRGFADPFNTLRKLPRLSCLFLDYAYPNIYCFPRQPLYLRRLRSLLIRGATMTGFLSHFSMLSMLTHITLEDLRFASEQDGADFFHALCTLEGLRELNINGYITSLDAGALSELSSLTRLNLSWTWLIPFTCSGTWRALKELNVSHCNLSEMPDGMEQLSALTSLDLGMQRDDFQLGGPMSFLESMPHLQYLNLKQNGDNDADHLWSGGSLCCLMEAEQVCKLRGQAITLLF